MARASLLLCLAVSLGMASCKDLTPFGGDDREPGDTNGPPRWRFTTVDHGLTDVTLTDVWGRSDGVVFAVGWYGAIITNRGGTWTKMASPTREHLTAIYGTENGGLFQLAAPEGEMIAVGWHGTILHYNPNPDKDATKEDGTWTVVSGPDAPTGLLARHKSDPACPDFDGDGYADDGDNSTWYGDRPCTNVITGICDDNCRGSANGDMRPILDRNADGCISTADGPDTNSTHWQTDVDGDGLGDVCDSDPAVAAPTARFEPTLFDVWMASQADQLLIIAVGEDGAVVTYEGLSASAIPTLLPVVTFPAAWIAQDGAAFRFDSDCGSGFEGATCPVGRLATTCPAKCNPVRTNCNCPPDQYICCDAGGSTGRPAAATGCMANGNCDIACPDCFRRLDKTLRSVSVGNQYALATGAAGTIVLLDLALPERAHGIWRHLECFPDSPLEDRPVLAGVSAYGDDFMTVGAAGTVVHVDVGQACELQRRTEAPTAFYSGVTQVGGDNAWVVGDHGLLLHVVGGNTPQVELVTTDVKENFLSVWRNTVPVPDADPDERLWLVGASGSMLQGDYY